MFSGIEHRVWRNQQKFFSSLAFAPKPDVKQGRSVQQQRAGAERRSHRLSVHRGLAKFQGHHTNQACYKSGIMSQDIHIRRHLVALKETAYPTL